MITCDKCEGTCCKRIAIQIEKPKTKMDIEDIKWIIYHKKVSVYIDNEDDWLVMFDSPCEHLTKEGKCAIYPKRPLVCRKADPKECERNIEETRVHFRTIEDLDRYMKKNSIR